MAQQQHAYSGKRNADDKSVLESASIIHTFLFFLPPPPPFFPPLLELNPFTSSSKIIDGGLTFFPHPCAADVVELSVTGSILEPSVVVGGAKITAVLETVAAEETLAVAATAAPTGSRAEIGFAFLGAIRRTGAKARLADHPEDTVRRIEVTT